MYMNVSSSNRTIYPVLVHRSRVVVQARIQLLVAGCPVKLYYYSDWLGLSGPSHLGSYWIEAGVCSCAENILTIVMSTLGIISPYMLRTTHIYITINTYILTHRCKHT